MLSAIEDIELIIHKSGHSVVDSSWSKRNFAYPHNRIYYITDGEAELTLTDKRIKLKKGYLYLLPAFMMVESNCKERMEHYFIHFQMNWDYTNNIYELMEPKLFAKGSNTEEIIRYFHIIEANYQVNDFSSILKSQGALRLLLASFFQDLAMKSYETQRFISVIDYIEKNLRKDIMIEDLADLLQLNPVYFSNLFSKTFGLPPRKFINKKRLELAQVLLLNTNKKVKDIAFTVGFENEMYFSKLFHKQMGLTPGEYRKISRQTT